MVVRVDDLEAIPIAHCNLGHAITPKHLWDKDGFGYYRCPACGFVWVSPQLTDASVELIYSRSFNPKHRTVVRPRNFLAYRSRLRRLDKYKKLGRLLDVGCSVGHFLLAAQSAGWQHTEGTEISPLVVSYARDHYGLTVHQGDLLTIDLPENAYDAITLSDVIEHVSDPFRTIQAAHQLLRPNGVLYMNTPHFRCIPRLIHGKHWNVFFPWHRSYFSANNMRLALEQAGFRIRSMSTVGVLPFGRYNAWQTYVALAHKKPQPEEQLIVPDGNSDKDSGTSAASRRATLRDWLRAAWLLTKSGMELPFDLLSKVHIYVGAKLIVYAEKTA